MSDDSVRPETNARGRLPGRASDTLDAEVAPLESVLERTIADDRWADIGGAVLTS